MKKENAADQKRVRPLTKAEKEKIAAKCKVEFENAPAEATPVEEFKTALAEYKKNMITQCENLKAMIKVHKQLEQHIKTRIEDTKGDEVTNKLYQEELGVRQNLLAQCTGGYNVMQKRLEMCDEITAWVVDNFDNVQKLDLFFNNGLNLPGTKEIMTKWAIEQK